LSKYTLFTLQNIQNLQNILGMACPLLVATVLSSGFWFTVAVRAFDEQFLGQESVFWSVKVEDLLCRWERKILWHD